MRVVAALLLRDGRLLLARRGPGMDLEGCWEFPGGKVEAGESAAAALERELEEELGIRTRSLLHLATSDFDGAGGRAIRLEGWLTHLEAGEPEVREHDALAWLLPEQVDRASLAPADGPLLDALIAHLADPAVDAVPPGA
ncbi:MAG TPA: NUDIX domain-containing protein [Pseudomonadales bacterium]|nr:NUDIX domain-containing protein [Pseudomonadales bacterium]